MLLVAVKRSNIVVVKLLLDHGADPNAVDGRGYRPLYQVAFAYRTEADRMTWNETSKQTAQMLLDYGADLNARFVDGRTVFLCVVVMQTRHVRVDLELVIWLIDKGADINLADTQTGHTALMVAAIAGRIDMVELFLEGGADVTKLDHAGRGVLDMLDGSWKYRRIVKLCKQYLDTNRPLVGLLLK